MFHWVTSTITEKVKSYWSKKVKSCTGLTFSILGFTRQPVPNEGGIAVTREAKRDVIERAVRVDVALVAQGSCYRKVTSWDRRRESGEWGKLWEKVVWSSDAAVTSSTHSTHPQLNSRPRRHFRHRPRMRTRVCLRWRCTRTAGCLGSRWVARTSIPLLSLQVRGASESENRKWDGAKIVRQKKSSEGLCM